jgi:hypothetical protein
MTITDTSAILVVGKLDEEGGDTHRGHDVVERCNGSLSLRALQSYSRE